MKNCTDHGFAAYFCLAGVLLSNAAAASTGCEALTSPGLFADTTIVAASNVAPDASKQLPGYCELVGVIAPVPGSKIGVVYRLPTEWNGKLLGLGGGGWAGNIRLETATPGLRAGYATAQTNGGHESTQPWDNSWASNPESLTDFSYRAIHLMTVTGKAVVQKFYGKPHSHTYFQGCSTGGRQALMEVQRFPDDYNGVISGAPVYSLVTQTSAVLRNQAFASSGAALTHEQVVRLNIAALAACDARDGLADGIVTDPRTCNFDPATLQCPPGGSGNECLSEAQVNAVRLVYAGVRTSAGAVAAYPLTRGGEAGWDPFVSAVMPAAGQSRTIGSQSGGLGGLRALIFKDPNYDLDHFVADRDLPIVRGSALARMYEATDPDIATFVRRGGKLLLWHGFDDPGPSPYATIDYFEAVQHRTGHRLKTLDSSVRLFLAPGVYHCRGGPGPDQFDLLGAIDTWVDKGNAPATLLATSKASALSRPLCPYPALPRYDGSGDPNDAANFSCR